MKRQVEQLNDEAPVFHQTAFGTKLDQLISLANEMRTGLVAGAFSDAILAAVDELYDDHATFRTVVGDLKTLLNQLRSHALNQALGNPGFTIVSNFDVKNDNAISYLNGGTLKTLAANQTFDTGTSQVIVADKWSAALLSLDASGNPVLTWAATLNAASEAAAIAVLPALPANNTPLGYVTVKTASGQTWTAGTDALQGGTGGNPASTTNYYNSVSPNAAIVGAAVSSSAPAALSSDKPDGASSTFTNGAVDTLN